MGGLQDFGEDTDVNPSDKVALVTGAARRVGRAIALELAESGYDIAIHFNSSEQEAREAAEIIRQKGRRAALVRGELADPNVPERILREVVAELGRLDVLVNSASSFDRVAFEQVDAAAWERTFAVNTIAPALLARTAAPIMRAAGGGRIVNMIDIMAGRAVKGYAAYLASKAALASITRSLALELAPEITVNGVAPGIAVFPEYYDQATRERLVSRVPLGRPGSPEEVARLVRFLVMEGDYITGAIIPIDGGRSVRM
jgi:pteridine reductase